MANWHDPNFWAGVLAAILLYVVGVIILVFAGMVAYEIGKWWGRRGSHQKDMDRLWAEFMETEEGRESK